MSRNPRPTMAGYAPFRVGDAEGMAQAELLPDLSRVLQEGTLYDYAAHHPLARPLVGRGVVYAVPLPDDERWAVVRRSRHGGLLAPVTGEIFFGATRAPTELMVSLRLARVGVPTPELLAFATYSSSTPLFRRADVMTRLIPDARDLATVLLERPDDAAVRPALIATAALLSRMTIAGARHPDLNARNVLIAEVDGNDPEGYVLDVDRVWFDAPGSPRVTEANLRRLAHSLRKLRRTAGLELEEADILWLGATVNEMLGTPA